MIRVEFFDVARVRAGVASIEVQAATMSEALAAAAARCPGLEPDVLRGGLLAPHWRASLNGAAFVDDPSLPLSPGDALLILSALAGG